MKKIFIFIMIFASMFLLTGCGNEEKETDKKDEEKQETTDKEIEGTLEEIMASLYEDVPEEERPMMLMNIEINDENIAQYLGTDEIKYKEALASESAVGSIAHSVVLLRAEDKADVEDIKKAIKENVRPNKWLCVEAEKVSVKSRGTLVLLIMSTKDNASRIENTFNNL